MHKRLGVLNFGFGRSFLYLLSFKMAGFESNIHTLKIRQQGENIAWEKVYKYPADVEGHIKVILVKHNKSQVSLIHYLCHMLLNVGREWGKN